MAITPQWLRSLFTGKNNPDVDYFKVAANQTIKTGEFVQINAATGLLEVAAAGSTTIVGLANGPITTGAKVTTENIPVALVKSAVVRMNFSNAGTKKTFDQADLYTKAFDISNPTTVNPDSDTGGMMQVVAYNNEKLTVDVVITSAAQYLK
jgi:hypothetical protein